MINKFIFTSAVGFLLCFTSQSKADWVLDFNPGLSTRGPLNFSFTQGANFKGTLFEDHTNGHRWELTGVDGNDPDRKANIRYEFPSLLANLDPNGIGGADKKVKFYTDLTSNSNEGVFFVVGTAERASGAIYTFTNDSGGTPGDPNGSFEWITAITMGDLAADDIVALNFEITYDFTGGFGFDQVFTFGGPGGLVATPEPTSAAMIGCALVGLIARRRRKS